MSELTKEEKANVWTHVVPFAAMIGMGYPLISRAWNAQALHPAYQVLGTALFVLGSLLMFGSSTAYHAAVTPVYKARLRVFDHISIYAMIAGSYSLICLSVVGGWMGWTLSVFLWGCVIAGTIGKVIALGKHPRLSLALYLLMGWVAVLIIVPMWQKMPHVAFLWIIAEGIFYTVGAYFFKHDEEHSYWHAIWHVFITFGAISHTIATWLILA